MEKSPKQTMKTAKKLGSKGRGANNKGKNSAEKTKTMVNGQKSANVTKVVIDKNGKKVVRGAETNNRVAATGKKWAVERVKPTPEEKKKLGKKGIIAIAVVIVALVGSSLGFWALCGQHGEEPETGENTSVEEQPEEPEEPKEPEPVENKDPLAPEPSISDNSAYQVAGYKPRYMSIPSLGLYNIPIIEVGKEGDGTLGAPRSDYVIAWYYRSAIPGQPGASVMDGHGGDLGTGILKTLPRVPMGGEIIVEMGDGRKFTYYVEEKTYKMIGADADNYMDTAYRPLRPGVPTIALITCTGRWIRAQQTYDQRLFVRAAMK